MTLDDLYAVIEDARFHGERTLEVTPEQYTAILALPSEPRSVLNAGRIGPPLNAMELVVERSVG